MNELKPIDAPVYSYWKALYYAFYSRRLYVDVGKRWRGFGFLYLLLVVCLLSVPLATRVANVYKQDINQQMVEPLLKMPTLYVQNGEISIDQPVPYLIKNKNNQVVLIIDTSNKISGFEQQYPYLTILINKNTISFRLPGLQIFQQQEQAPTTTTPIVQTLGKEVNTVFNGQQFIESSTIPSLIRITQWMLYPLIGFVLSSFFMVLFPVLAFMGQVFSNVFFSFQITYKQASRLLIVSATPMILILMLFLFMDKVFMGMGILLVGLLIAYYSFALLSLKAESQQMVK